MGYSVTMPITPHAAAKLLISGEIDASAEIPNAMAHRILDEIINLSIEECLAIIDMNQYGDIAEVRYIPQFGKIETVFRVPYYFSVTGQPIADFPQIGFYLKQDVNASLGANTKFGENHGKVASLIGITSCVECKIVPSAFTYAFCSYDETKQREIAAKLFLRIPIIQIILKNATKGKFNGYSCMCTKSESTLRRRGFSIKAILNFLSSLDNDDLINRINNIYWNVEEVTCNEKI